MSRPSQHWQQLHTSLNYTIPWYISFPNNITVTAPTTPYLDYHIPETEIDPNDIEYEGFHIGSQYNPIYIPDSPPIRTEILTPEIPRLPSLSPEPQPEFVEGSSHNPLPFIE